MCYGEVLSASMIKARKEHRCGICRKVIIAGKIYHKQSVAEDGSVYIFKSCAKCHISNVMGWDEAGEDMCYIDPRESAMQDAKEKGWRKYISIFRETKKRIFNDK